MPKAKNILFIMCDQLRYDYLSCYGHPHLKTPNIDALAKRGVKFTNAYVPSPICGPSRGAIYTGRYISSCGTTVNFSPLPVGEYTLGDYLNPLGVRTALVGKSHIFPDMAGMARLAIAPESEEGRHVMQGGFEPYWRDDGLHPNLECSKNTVYNQYLRAQGYEGDNPWHTHANSAVDSEGQFRDGWFLENAPLAANIREEHSETPYTTRRAMDFIEEATDTPWCLHLSYIKPHWPLMAPAPYHKLYSAAEVLPANKSAAEHENPHPFYDAYIQHNHIAKTYSDDAKRSAIVPTYMGLIKQIDDQIGLLMHFLDAKNLLESTLIVFTSDHGDNLGDHWLGEKNFFHDCSVRAPLIVIDPSEQADSTRGSSSDALVNLIDLVPTFVDYHKGDLHDRLEGRSLLPLLHGTTPKDWRSYVISEIDYSDRSPKWTLNKAHEECWTTMIFDGRYKYIAFNGYRPMLFDLLKDPQELNDLGEHPEYAPVREKMQQDLLEWFLTNRSRRIHGYAASDASTANHGVEKRGIYIGYWSEKDLPEAVQKQIKD